MGVPVIERAIPCAPSPSFNPPFHPTHITHTRARAQERLNRLEAELAEHRNDMALGHTDPATGELVRGSSVQVRMVPFTST